MKLYFSSLCIAWCIICVAWCTSIDQWWHRSRDYGFGGYELTTEQKKTCGISIQTTEWPYYVSNTPYLTDGNLNSAKLSGTSLILSGKVYGGLDNNTPISGAMIEIWQADDDGKYYPQANWDYTNYQASDIKLRGYVLTNAQGVYQINTIYPWLYEWRARHIHFRVSAQKYNPIITQLILPFPWDTPSVEDDNVAQWLPDCQIIVWTTNQSIYHRTFDFRLQAE